METRRDFLRAKLNGKDKRPRKKKIIGYIFYNKRWQRLLRVLSIFNSVVDASLQSGSQTQPFLSFIHPQKSNSQNETEDSPH